MFDIGFWEILLIGVVTLLVVGPERLPGVAVFAGHWIGRLRRFVNHMRAEINRELEAEHLRQLLDEQHREIDELRQEVKDVQREARSELEEQVSTSARPGEASRDAAADRPASEGDTR